MRKFGSVVGLFTLCFALGYGLLKSNTEEYQIQRDPAAIRGKFDFSDLRGHQLQNAVKARLLTGLQLKKSPEGTGIGLGHFVFVNAKNEKRLACQEFQKVSLNFEAEGMSVGGDKPQMEIQGECVSTPDLSGINPLFVPVAKILNERPGDGEFQFNEGRKLTVRFENVPEAWPKLWLLKSVKLINEKDSEAFVIESDEVAQTLGHPVVFSW